MQESRHRGVLGLCPDAALRIACVMRIESLRVSPRVSVHKDTLALLVERYELMEKHLEQIRKQGIASVAEYWSQSLIDSYVTTIESKYGREGVAAFEQGRKEAGNE